MTKSATQTEIAAELDALLPSILDKAFRGELSFMNAQGQTLKAEILDYFSLQPSYFSLPSPAILPASPGFAEISDRAFKGKL